MALAAASVPAAARTEAPYGLESREPSKPFLNLPDRDTGSLPQRLSEVGAFRDLKRLEPARGLVPYALNVPFFSDNAQKSRWVSIPTGAQAAFAAVGEWSFPTGTVFVKHFDLAMDETEPHRLRRLETRFLVRSAAGSVYGVTYKWRPDNSDADLLATNLSETLVIKTASGMRTQSWYYPSRQDCRACHTDLNGGVLGLNTRQLNGDLGYPNGVVDNQLRAWSHAGLLAPAPDLSSAGGLARLAPASDAGRSLEDRARSYLDANCSHCHRPGGTPGFFDARYDTPLSAQNLVNGDVLIDQGIDRPHVIAPHDVWRSIAYLRVSTLDSVKMPPLAHGVRDESGVALLQAWIDSLPGPNVLAPPAIVARPLRGGALMEVALSHPEPGAVIRYTLDGSAPSSTDPAYDKPLQITEATVVRARAFKAGFKKSIASQQILEIKD